ncbi:hypothetical protein CHU98_g5099 [Xylaria longipes]|nr:hypothetical protein CHU98_g5099 [Xylaria longipes]
MPRLSRGAALESVRVRLKPRGEVTAQLSRLRCTRAQRIKRSRCAGSGVDRQIGEKTILDLDTKTRYRVRVKDQGGRAYSTDALGRFGRSEPRVEDIKRGREILRPEIVEICEREACKREVGHLKQVLLIGRTYLTVYTYQHKTVR